MRPLIGSLVLATSLLARPSQTKSLPFPYEQVQLTREHVASLPLEEQKLFAFAGQFDDGSELSTNAAAQCRYRPGDGKWPSEKGWQKLAKALSSQTALIKTVPLSAVCYPGPTANEAKCQDLTKNWASPSAHTDDPTDVLAPFFQGLTCTPPQIYNSGGCALGGFPSYVVNATTVLDLQLGINFARNSGLRLVVKNTGHDLAGKSAGAGALSLWTHGLKDMQYFENYVDGSGYRGPAVKAGAGVQVAELYKLASEKGVVAVAGSSPTVGAMGGYILGGGHSPLSALYGMAADHVLGFEVVTPMGDFVTANSASEPDLFWALRGGGGSTFGVVTSVTIKVYKDMPITSASWTIDSANIGKDRFWAAVKAFVDRILAHVDAGTYSAYSILPTGKGDYTFRMQPFFAPNQTAKQVSALLGPYFAALNALNVPFAPRIAEYKSFLPAWQAEFAPDAIGTVNGALSSRLFPRSNFATETGRNITFNAFRTTVEAGLPLIAVQMAPTLARGGNPDNAVSPAWRAAVLHAISVVGWPVPSSPEAIRAIWSNFTEQTMQRWRDITPGSGSYLNEADRMEPNWQQSFWGDNYARLLQIKQDYDWNGVFWAANAVGSEEWAVESADGLPTENGKLCMVNGTTKADVR